MTIDELTHEGTTFNNVPVDGLTALGLSDREISLVVLAQAKTDKLKHLSQLHASALREMTGDATLEENLTWTPKEMAARSLVAGTASDSERSLIACEAEITGDDPLRLAQYVVGKKELNYPIIGKLSGFRRKSKHGIVGAETLSEVERAFSEFSESVDNLKSSL